MATRKELTEQIKELTARLKAAEDADFQALIGRIELLIAESGFDLGFELIFPDKIAPEPEPEPEPKASRWFVLVSDPTKKYGGHGPYPAWMKAAMADLGLDSTSAKDREAFRAEHMRVIA